MKHPTTTQTLRAADASLVAMAKAGDEAAVDQLVGKYWSLAYRVAVRILHSHEDAEEAAQDALWAAVKHLPAYREDACFSTWLHRIAVNHSLMALRRRRSRAPESQCPLPIDAPPKSLQGPRTPEELLLESECLKLVDEGFSRVPAKFSVALHLSACEGRSAIEIADYMGITTSAVKARVHRGRAYLRREVLPRLCVKAGRTSEVRKSVQRCRSESDSAVAA